MRATDVERPNPLQWLRYVYTGRIARKYSAWVLYDATCRTWIVRHAARYLMLIAPLLAAVLLFLPAPMSVRLEACIAAGGSLLLGYLCFTTESLEHRVERAGYLYGLAAQLREERATAAQRAVAARSRQRRDGRLQQR